MAKIRIRYDIPQTNLKRGVELEGDTQKGKRGPGCMVNENGREIWLYAFEFEVIKENCDEDAS